MNLRSCKPGDKMVRLVPPIDGAPAYAQAGTIDRITHDTIELLVQVDVVRRMRFRREDGQDCQGSGSFLVSGQYLGQVLQMAPTDTQHERRRTTSGER